MLHLQPFEIYTGLLKYFTILRKRGYKDEKLTYGLQHEEKMKQVSKILASEGISTKFVTGKSNFTVIFSW